MKRKMQQGRDNRIRKAPGKKSVSKVCLREENCGQGLSS